MNSETGSRNMFALLTSLTRGQKQAILLTLDVILVPLALIVAVALTLDTLAPFAVLSGLWPVLAGLMILAAAGSAVLGLPRIQLKSYEVSAMGRSALLAGMLGAVLAVLATLGQVGLPAGTHIVFAVLFLLFSAIARIAMLQLLRRVYSRARALCRVVIYGAGNTGMQLALALKTHETIVPVAFVDDNTVLQKLTVAGLPVHPPSRLHRLIAAREIDRVLLAMPSAGQPRQSQIARRVADLGVEVQALPSFAQLIGEEALVDKLAPVLPGRLLGRDRLDGALRGGGEAYAERSVLVSGAGGSIGSELCRQILDCRPTRLVLLELSEIALYTVARELEALAEGTGCEVVPVLGSVTDRRLVRGVFETHGVQAVLHAAAYKHVPLVEANPLAGLANNVLGTRVLAQAARAAGVERFVLVSTDKAVNPIGVMGASKRLAELVVADLARRSEGTVFATVRFGNVLGSSGSVVPLFQEQIARGGPVTVTHPEATRYFMTVREATKLVLRAGSLAAGGEVFVLDMGQPVQIATLARQVIEASGYTVRDAENPRGDIEIRLTGLRPGEKLHEALSAAEGLEATAHPKILRAPDPGLSEFGVARALRALQTALAAGDAGAARAEALRWTAGVEAPLPDTHSPAAAAASASLPAGGPHAVH